MHALFSNLRSITSSDIPLKCKNPVQIRYLDPDYDPDRVQTLISSSMSRHLSTRNISSKSIHAFFSNLANRQTDRQTRANAFTFSVCRRYSAISNNIKMVHWPLMGVLLHLVQRGGDWAGKERRKAPISRPHTVPHGEYQRKKNFSIIRRHLIYRDRGLLQLCAT